MDDSNGQPSGAPSVPDYHRRLVEHLTSTEPELWSWFSESSAVADRQDDAAEVALLTSAYRLDGGVHDVLTGHASMLADRLGITESVVLFQELGSADRNAQVFRLNGRVNVVFSGDLLDLLEGDEALAVLAHELAHIALWDRDDGTFLVLDHLVHRLASEPQAADAVVETARRLRLQTEVWADAVAVDVTGDVAAVVASIVKVQSGIRHVEPDAYLRQAAEILELDDRSSQAWTHPELHIRVACIEARQRGTAESVIARLVNGPDDLDRLDLLGQLRMQTLTARVLGTGRSVAGDHPGVEEHLRSFPDLDVSAATPIHEAELAGHEPSVRWMAAALLVDLGLSEGVSDGLDDLRRLSLEAERQGTATEFDTILARATDRTDAEAKAIRDGGR